MYIAMPRRPWQLNLMTKNVLLCWTVLSAPLKNLIALLLTNDRYILPRVSYAETSLVSRLLEDLHASRLQLVVEGGASYTRTPMPLIFDASFQRTVSHTKN